MKRSILLLSIFCLCTSVSVMGQQTVQVVLSGMDQVPKVRTPASGMLDVTVKGDSLIVEGSFSDLRGNFTGMAIYHGREGQQGNQLIKLTVDINEDHKGGTVDPKENSIELREGIKSALSQGMLYLSITSDRFRQGEIRGQIPSINP
ncbi:MAG: CHRD domain-containing protein [Balneolaceae bacterium]